MASGGGPTDYEGSVVQAVGDARQELVDLTRALVRIPSVTGEEGAVQKEIETRFRQAGLETDVWIFGEELLPYPELTQGRTDFSGRPNVVGTLKGADGGRSLILNGHVDVVSPGEPALWAHYPWAADVADGRIYGRGSVDMKGGLAAALVAISAVKRAGVPLAGDVIIQSVVGEEGGGLGTMAAILRGYRADAAVVMEPTHLAVVPAQGGLAAFRLTVKGRAAHAAMRDEGVSAVEKFCLIAHELAMLERRRNASIDHPLYHHISNKVPLNIGVVHAGTWRSTVPDQLVAEGRYGLMPDEDASVAIGMFEDTLESVCAGDPWLRDNPPAVEWTGLGHRGGQISAGDPIVSTIAGCYDTVFDRKATVEGVPYAADMELLIRYAGVPTVLFGPGDIRQAHFVDEYVEIDQLLGAAQVLALAILRWCSQQLIPDP